MSYFSGHENMKYKSELIKYKTADRYDLKLYIPKTQDLADFISYHIFRKLKQKKYISREYNNKNQNWDV